jgi:HlyD family secretion protein
MTAGNHRRLLTSIAVVVGIIAISLSVPFWRMKLSSPPQVADPPTAVTAVACAGHIEPEHGVTKVSAGYVNGRPGIVLELRVAEGDRVRSGQILAILDGDPQLRAALRQGEARVALAQSKVEQVRAGPKPGDVAAQDAEVARCRLAVETARAEFQRYEFLRQKHDVSASDLDAKRLEMESSQRFLEKALAILSSLSQVRPEDIRLAESELQVARADLDRLRLDLESTTVRSPTSGRVLRVFAQRGEEVGPEGLVELADTSSMYVIAEVYETDIGRVRLGQSVRIASELLPAPLRGIVTALGRQVARPELVSVAPEAFSHSRVVNVRVRLLESAAAANLIHGKVSAVFEP